MKSTQVLSLSATLLLLVVVVPTSEAAWIVRFPTDDTWATGFARFQALRRPMIVTTDFHDASDETPTADGTMDTDCRVIIGDGSGYWVEMPFEHPQLCVGGALCIQDEQGVGLLVGIDGKNSTLLTINGVGTDVPTPGDTFPLSAGKIPVAVDFGDESDEFIYVALHDIAEDAVYSGFGKDRATNLKGIINYWQKFTDPVTLNADQDQHVPHVIKKNPKTGEISWLGIYEAGGGSATIAAMTYADFSLIVCGSTNESEDGMDDNDDWDGYVSFINPVTGKVGQDGMLRITSGEEAMDKNDFVNDLCVLGDDLYVVGTTEGNVEGSGEAGGAFLVKIDIQRRSITAQKQVPGGPMKTGLKIECSPDAIYVGGHKTFDPQFFDEQQVIWVASYSTDLDVLNWSVDVDSTPYYGERRIDQLVDLDYNPAGDCNILWNSLDLDQGISVVMLMDMQSADGANQLQNGASVSDPAGVSKDGLAGVEPIKDGNGVAQQNTLNAEREEKKDRRILAVSITIPVTLALAVVIYTIISRKRKANELKVTPPPFADDEPPVEKEGTQTPVV